MCLLATKKNCFFKFCSYKLDFWYHTLSLSLSPPLSLSLSLSLVFQFDIWLILHLSKHNLNYFKLIRNYFIYFSFVLFAVQVELLFFFTKMILKYLLLLLLITDCFSKGKLYCFNINKTCLGRFQDCGRGKGKNM